MGRKFYQAEGKDVIVDDYAFNGPYMEWNKSTQLKEYFNNYGVPEEYQKVFFYNSAFYIAIREFLTGTVFGVRDINKKSISAISKKIVHEKGVDFKAFILNSEVKVFNKKEVMDFYVSLYENGYINIYLDALNDFFIANKKIKHTITEITEQKKEDEPVRSLKKD